MNAQTKVVIRPPATPEEFAEYFDLRYRVFRRPLGYPEDSVRDEFDTDGQSRHFAAYLAGTTVGVARLQRNTDGLYWVRWVAVDPNQRIRKIGQSLMGGVEHEARRLLATQLTLNARNTAVKFYIKLGYEVVGPAPPVRDTAGKVAIEQTKMTKYLQ